MSDVDKTQIKMSMFKKIIYELCIVCNNAARGHVSPNIPLLQNLSIHFRKLVSRFQPNLLSPDGKKHIRQIWTWNPDFKAQHPQMAIWENGFSPFSRWNELKTKSDKWKQFKQE